MGKFEPTLLTQPKPWFRPKGRIFFEVRDTEVIWVGFLHDGINFGKESAIICEQANKQILIIVPHLAKNSGKDSASAGLWRKNEKT